MRFVAVYERPEQTKSKIFLTDSVRDEDKFQGKVGLVVKMGPDAFVDSGGWVFQRKAAVGDWSVVSLAPRIALRSRSMANCAASSLMSEFRGASLIPTWCGSDG